MALQMVYAGLVTIAAAEFQKDVEAFISGVERRSGYRQVIDWISGRNQHHDR